MALARAFDACARDEAFRGLMEWRRDAGLPLRAYRLLEDEGVLWRDHEPVAVALAELGLGAGAFALHPVRLHWLRAREVAPALEDGRDPEALLMGAVAGYALRDRDRGAELRPEAIA